MNRDKLGKLVLFAGVASIAAIGMLYNESLKGLPQKYSVCTIKTISKPLKGGYQAIYEYSLDGKLYSNSVNIGDYQSVAKVGAKFIVSVPVGHLGSGRILFDMPVQDSTKAPRNGWNQKPKKSF